MIDRWEGRRIGKSHQLSIVHRRNRLSSLFYRRELWRGRGEEGGSVEDLILGSSLAQHLTYRHKAKPTATTFGAHDHRIVDSSDGSEVGSEGLIISLCVCVCVWVCL